MIFSRKNSNANNPDTTQHDILEEQDRTSWNKLFHASKSKLKLPTPIKELLDLKTAQARKEYLENLPKPTLEAITSAFLFVVLKGQILQKAKKIGISIPADVSDFVNDIEQKVKQKGELTIAAVKDVIQAMKDTASWIATIVVISFILMNPLIWPIVIPIFVMIDIVTFIKLFTDGYGDNGDKYISYSEKRSNMSILTVIRNLCIGCSIIIFSWMVVIVVHDGLASNNSITPIMLFIGSLFFAVLAIAAHKFENFLIAEDSPERYVERENSKNKVNLKKK